MAACHGNTAGEEQGAAEEEMDVSCFIVLPLRAYFHFRTWASMVNDDCMVLIMCDINWELLATQTFFRSH